MPHGIDLDCPKTGDWDPEGFRSGTPAGVPTNSLVSKPKLTASIACLVLSSEVSPWPSEYSARDMEGLVFCEECGKEVNIRAKYCEYCGTKAATRHAAPQADLELAESRTAMKTIRRESSGLTQCQNCGGFKVVESEIRNVNLRTGKEYAKPGCFFLGMAWTFVVTGFLMLLIQITVGAARNWTMLLWSLVAVPVGLFMLFAASRKTRVRRTYYKCSLCGYKWNRLNTDPPPPTVTPRPDLIQKGAQKLEEEEEENQQAAAAYYLEQQRRNRR